jgi:hypothetical protein
MLTCRSFPGAKRQVSATVSVRENGKPHTKAKKKCRFVSPLVVNTITSIIYSPCPVSNANPLPQPVTYTEDGTNSGSFDGRPDQPLDDRVGLWITVSTTLSIA